MSAVPFFVFGGGLYFAQPFFCGLVHACLTEKRQENLDRLIYIGTGVGKYYIYRVIYLFELTFHIELYVLVWLFAFKPVPASGKAYVFVDAVSAADDHTVPPQNCFCL